MRGGLGGPVYPQLIQVGFPSILIACWRENESKSFQSNSDGSMFKVEKALWVWLYGYSMMGYGM